MKHTLVTTPHGTFCCLCKAEGVTVDGECPFYSLLEPGGQGDGPPERLRHAFTEASRPLCHYCGCPEDVLTTDCPRQIMSKAKLDKVRALVADFVNGEWKEL